MNESKDEIKNWDNTTDDINSQYEKDLISYYSSINYWIKGMIYYPDKLKSVLDSNHESKEQFFKTLEMFLTYIHPKIMQELKHNGWQNNKLLKIVRYFEEELFRMFSILPIHYTHNELSDSITNLDFFEKEMERN